MKTTCSSCRGTGKGKMRVADPNFWMASAQKNQYIERNGYDGFEKISTMEVECNCGTCGGSGEVEYRERKVSCDCCDGTGYQSEMVQTDNEGYHYKKVRTRNKCLVCDGKGRVII